MDKQEILSELNHYFMTKMCHAAAECLELQCSQQYWCEIEEGYRATVIHRIRPKERANLPTENLQAKFFLAKFVIIVFVPAR